MVIKDKALYFVKNSSGLTYTTMNLENYVMQIVFQIFISQILPVSNLAILV